MDEDAHEEEEGLEPTACLSLDWLTHIHPRQNQKLVSSSSTWERLRAYHTLLGSNDSMGPTPHACHAVGTRVSRDETRGATRTELSSADANVDLRGLTTARSQSNG
ncbi:hypothetical protein BHE74_00039054 [Ensete ventricosum]|nr:hypothetical protein BHE74_00039054 [Ensete ventricosum]